MELSRGSELASKVKPLSSGCEETTRCSEALQPAAEPPSELPESSPPEPQPPGRLRKTAFKLFGGRKSICSLPSFFGGKNKSQGKGSSKKGISKSKTHDSINRLAWEDSRGAGCVTTGDFEYHGQKVFVGKTLTSSVSVHAINDPGKRTDFPKGESSHTLSLESGGHKLSSDKSSLSLPRSKKGLKGLFSSIRRHRKNKNVESEKSETFEMSLDISKDLVPICGLGVDQHDFKHQSGLAGPKVPALDLKDGFVISQECIKDKALSENDITLIKGDSEPLKQDRILRDAVSDVKKRTGILKANEEALCSNSEFTYPPNMNPDCTENDQPSLRSSDQISFIFGDVASLKSFDSLTGCGDIIADKDDDSVAESTISGERSRNAGKRSSCYVTYQGGGEEMATPNEVDGNYLQGLWEEVGKADVCYTSSQLSDHMEQGESLTPGLVSCEMGVTRSSTFHAVVDCSLATGDLLTPQSDQQESVPTSDEGYYDSTTPGPDEDGSRVCRLVNERLPRDSYSGDALYELFEADDSLMSPSLEHMSAETQPPTPDPLEFLGMTLQSNNVHPAFDQKTDLMGAEESRLTKLQQDLLCCELQSLQKAPKEPIVVGKGRYHPEQSLAECVPRLQKQHQLSIKEDEVILQLKSQKGTSGMQQQAHHLEASSEEAVPCNGGGSQKKQDKLPHKETVEAVCSTHISKTSRPLLELSPCMEQGKPSEVLTKNKGKNICSSKEEEEVEHSQTVSFSQALVDFTKHSKLFRGLTDGLEGSESSSSFAQNIVALPAMVTFDVVDMEDDGECDRQIDMATDEDIVSPHEAFDESYLQKDAFAECDKIFEFYDRTMFLGNTWGVASLPRHLSLTRVNQPMPVPLSLNRRSRSLDTDSLELGLGGLCLGQSRVSPSLILTTRLERDSKRASPLQCKQTGHAADSEMRNSSKTVAASWQQEPAASFPLPSADGRTEFQVPGLIPAPKERVMPSCGLTGSLEAEPGSHTSSLKTRTNILKPDVGDSGACNSTPHSTGYLTRPSHLPLRSRDSGSQPQRTLTRVSRESSYDKTHHASDDQSVLCILKNYGSPQYSETLYQHAKMKPIGVTQGMPHFHSGTSGVTKAAFLQEHRELVKKGRKVVDGALPAECDKRAT